MLSRRAFLGFTALMPPMVRLWGSAPQNRTVPLVSLDEFLEVSARLLERPKLDPEVAQIYLSALLADRETGVTLANLVASNGNPTPELRALSATIVEWWYTGVYTVGGDNRVATHTGALVWNAMSMPAPGTCAGPFGAWSRPPV